MLQLVLKTRAGPAAPLQPGPGTGYSPGVRGDIKNDQALRRDYRRFRVEIDRRVPGVPVFLVGHNAGAAVAADIAPTGTPGVAGVVLVNAAYRLRDARRMTPTWRQYVAYAANLLVRPSAPVVDMNSRPFDVAFGPDREGAIAMQRDHVPGPPARTTGSAKVVARDGGHGSSAVETTSSR